MKDTEICVCIMRVGGTNCDVETQRVFEELGVQAETVHLNKIVKKKNLLEYSALVFPGGFAYGDYVRAGAVWAKGTLSRLRSDLAVFVEEERPILGICNGFQVLVEAGMLPGFNGTNTYPEASLATNVPLGYNCSWAYVTHENSGRCIFTQGIPKGRVLRMPVAHAEGRFLLSKKREDMELKRLIDNDQLVFRYCSEEGEYAKGGFPINPNGSFYDIAGICDPTGTILGLMPHPERAYYGWQLPDWTRNGKTPKYGDGRLIFQSMIHYLKRKA